MRKLLATLVLFPLCLSQMACDGDLGTRDLLEAENYEVRWFFDGEIPREVEEWLARFVSERESREDIYLITNNKDISPKLRGAKSRLELKYRLHALSIDVCGNSGRLENWKKKSWDYQAPSEPDPVRAAFLADEQGRVAIWKDRRQVKFRVTRDTVHQVPVAVDTLKAGALLEVTALRAWGRPFWTVAADAFGFQNEPISYLESSLCKVLAEFPVIMDEAGSRGYSQWLGEQVE